MKITKQQLKRIIKEELANVLAEQYKEETRGNLKANLYNAAQSVLMSPAGDPSYQDKIKNLITTLDEAKAAGYGVHKQVTQVVMDFIALAKERMDAGDEHKPSAWRYIENVRKILKLPAVGDQPGPEEPTPKPPAEAKPRPGKQTGRVSPACRSAQDHWQNVKNDPKRAAAAKAAVAAACN